MHSYSFQKSIDAFKKLPGIGPRQATRCIFYLLKSSPEEFKDFLESLNTVREKSQTCKECFRVFEAGSTPYDICDICRNPKRERDTIMIVENDQDLIAIERLKTFNGVYVVFGKIRSGTGLNENIVSRILETAKKEKRKEIILATNPTLEGNSLAYRIKEGMDDPEIKITRLARGLPTGSEIEYADEDTLSEAIKGRS